MTQIQVQTTTNGGRGVVKTLLVEKAQVLCEDNDGIACSDGQRCDLHEVYGIGVCHKVKPIIKLGVEHN